jgi:hypothetical protein
VDAQFARYRYDKHFEVERRATGTLAADWAGRAVYRLIPATIAPGEQSKKKSRNGEPYTLKADDADRWHWTGETVIRVDDRARVFEEMDLRQGFPDTEFVPEAPPLPDESLDDDTDQPAGNRTRPVTNTPQARAANSSRAHPWFGDVLLSLIVGVLFQRAMGDLHDSMREFPLSRPFLLGMPAAELKEAFRIELMSQNDAEVWLKLSPKRPRERALYERAILILKRDDYTPRALKLADLTGGEMVHVFSDVQFNADSAPKVSPSLRNDHLGRPPLRGYRQTLPPAAASPRRKERLSGPEGSRQ